jgi:hypothetical protein
MTQQGNQILAESGEVRSVKSVNLEVPGLSETTEVSFNGIVPSTATRTLLASDDEIRQFIDRGNIVNSEESPIRRLMTGIPPINVDIALQSVERTNAALENSENINRKVLNVRDENFLLFIFNNFKNFQPLSFYQLRKIAKSVNSKVVEYREKLKTMGQNEALKAKLEFASELIDLISPLTDLTIDSAQFLLDEMLEPRFDLDLKNRIKKNYSHYDDIANLVSAHLQNAGISYSADSVTVFTKIACLKLNELYSSFISEVERTLEDPEISQEELEIKINNLRSKHLPDKLLILELAKTIFGDEQIADDFELQNKLCAVFFTHTSDNSFEDIIEGWSLGSKKSDITRVIDIKTNEEWWEYYKDAVRTLLNIFRLEKIVLADGSEQINTRTDSEALEAINNIFKRAKTLVIPSNLSFLDMSYCDARESAKQKSDLGKLLNAPDIGQYLLDRIVELSSPDFSKNSTAENSYKYRAESLTLLRTLLEAIYNKTLIQGQYSVENTEKVRNNLVDRFKDLNKQDTRCIYLGENSRNSHYFCVNLELEINGEVGVYPIVYELVTPKSISSMERKNLVKGTPVGEITDTLRASIYLPCELDAIDRKTNPKRKEELIQACIKAESAIMKQITGSDSFKYGKDAKWSFDAGVTGKFSNGSFEAFKSVGKINAKTADGSRMVIPIEHAFLFFRPDDHEMYDFKQYRQIQEKFALTGTDQFTTDLIRYTSELLSKIEANSTPATLVGFKNPEIDRLEICIDNLLDFFRYDKSLAGKNKADRSTKTREFVFENAKDALINIFATLSRGQHFSYVRSLVDPAKLNKLSEYILQYLNLDKKVTILSNKTKLAVADATGIISNDSFGEIVPGAVVKRKQSAARRTGGTSLTVGSFAEPKGD